jgi:hypothetical protein
MYEAHAVSEGAWADISRADAAAVLRFMDKRSPDKPRVADFLDLLDIPHTDERREQSRQMIDGEEVLREVTAAVGRHKQRLQDELEALADTRGKRTGTMSAKDFQKGLKAVHIER